MRKFLLFLVPLLFSVCFSNAQFSSAEENAAMQLVSANKAKLALSDEDLANLIVSTTYLDKSTGIRMVYLQQAYQRIPVYNQILVLAFKDNKLGSVAGEFNHNLQNQVNVRSGMPSVSAESAVQSALTDKGLRPTQMAIAINRKDDGRKVEFSNMGVSRENITAQLMWSPVENSDEFRLAWQVYFIPKINSDYWLVRVDAVNNSIVGTDNLTVYCNWDDPHHVYEFGINHNHLNDIPKSAFGGNNLFDFKTVAKTTQTFSPALADNGIYRVIPLPYEAPSFMPSPPSSAIVNNPWTAASANATTLKWHSTDATGTDYNYTRGNNVWAYHDRNNQNTGDPARSATSTTPLPNLTFDFMPDYTQQPTVTSPPNQQFNITNLFYFNNIIHDVLYAYGFDEPGGNFQDNNLGRGGNGNDHVNAEAQDGSGTNNANFSTPADGGSGRMQMYLWTLSTPQRDGDVDNGIIAHEFGHGVSNRLFGGPLNVSCVSNGESQGEGISDYISLMLTQDWANSTVNSGLIGRGIGTYALNQPTTGAGIRSQRYSTDMAINNHVYLASLPTAVHDRGEYWCVAAWEATWAIIQQAGTINPDIYFNGSSTAGNIVAMRIAMQAMKLAPCSSGFIDHRDGWLKADTLLYGGAYSCSIWEAFRKRGMGAFASQGSANSAGDQTPDFTAKSQVVMTASAPTIPEGQSLTYTQAVSTCSRVPISNYLLTDTLPLNVTFVSANNGGTYNAGNRVVSWVINQAANSTVNYQFTVTTNPGSFPGNVVMRSSLFNDGTPSLKRFNVSQVITPITPVVAGCPTVPLQPANTAVCANTPASFTTTVSSATTPVYQWQVSTTGPGGPWTNLTNAAPYSGVNTNTLSINPAAIGLNNNQYRCFVTNADCPAGIATNAAILNVYVASVSGSISPANSQVCGTTNTGTLTLSGHTGSVIRWESATVSGGPYTAIANTTTTLTYNNLTQTTYFRAVVQVTGCTAVNTAEATVTFVAAPAITIVADPGSTLCQGDPALLTVVSAPVVTCFTNTTPINITNTGSTPYPSNIAVSGLPAAGVNVSSVIFTGLSHTWSDDIDILLQSPTGQNVILMSDVGGSSAISNATYTFSDAGPPMSTGANPTGTYHPTNLVGTLGVEPDNWPAPGPGSVTQVSPALAMFTGNFNGTWKLFVVDDFAGDNGTMAGGWSICFSVPGAPITGGTFTWSPPAGLNQTTGNPVAASPMTTTTYTVNHDNGSGCVRQASITININLRPTVTTQPANTTVCSGLPATFTVAGTGTALTYQWQVSTTGAGGPWVNLANGTPYSGVNTATLTVNPVAVAMSGYRYRCVLGGTCPPAGTANISNGAILTVNALPVVTVTPTTGCGGVAGTNGLLLTASGASTYTWAPVTGLYTNANTTTPYTGGNTPTVYAAPTTFTVYTVTGTAAGTGCSNTASAQINYTPPAPTVTPASVTMCLGDPAVKLKSSSSTTLTASFASGNVNINIPDGPTIPPVPTSYPAVTSNITVSGIPVGATIANVRVRFNITHVWVSDLVIALKAPNGQIINLCALVNGTNNPGANFTNTVISSAGTNFLSTGTGPYTGTFRADLRGATFTALGFTWPGGPTGYVPTSTTWSSLYSTANGVWSIGIYDAGAPDGGTLNNWSLDIDYIVGVPATPAVWTPAAGLFSDANATVPYVAGTAVDSVWTRPTPSGVYNYQATVQSLPTPPVTVTTPMAGGNGNNLVAFNVRNNNAYPVTFSSISSNAFGAGAITARVFYSATPIAGNPGPISAANGWNQFGTGNYTVTANTLNQLMTGLTLVIPPGTTYGIALDFTGATFPAYTNGTGTVVTYSSGGCDIITDGNVGWGGPASPGTPANNPRNFNGSVAFIPASGAPCTSPARNIVVTVNQPTTITTQPTAKVICTDKVATYTVAAGGSGPFSYQWQVSTNSGNTWTNVSNGGVYSGATSATLTISGPPVSMSGYFYRCIVTGAAPCASVTSFQAQLTVNPLPTVVISAAPYRSLFPGLTTTITSSVTPNAAATYTWQRNGVTVPGNTGTLNVNVDGLGDYRLTVTDVNGCTNSSNTITIKDSASGKCFIYPNPNSGMFQVRYYSVANNVLPRSLTVYDAQGNRVMTQFYTIGRPYDRMDVDLRKNGKGLYWVEIGDLNGNRLTMCRVVIQ